MSRKNRKNRNNSRYQNQYDDFEEYEEEDEQPEEGKYADLYDELYDNSEEDSDDDSVEEEQYEDEEEEEYDEEDEEGESEEEYDEEDEEEPEEDESDEDEEDELDKEVSAAASASPAPAGGDLLSKLRAQMRPLDTSDASKTSAPTANAVNSTSVNSNNKPAAQAQTPSDEKKAPEAKKPEEKPAVTLFGQSLRGKLLNGRAAAEAKQNSTPDSVSTPQSAVQNSQPVHSAAKIVQTTPQSPSVGDSRQASGNGKVITAQSSFVNIGTVQTRDLKAEKAAEEKAAQEQKKKEEEKKSLEDKNKKTLDRFMGGEKKESTPFVEKVKSAGGKFARGVKAFGIKSWAYIAIAAIWCFAKLKTGGLYCWSGLKSVGTYCFTFDKAVWTQRFARLKQATVGRFAKKSESEGEQKQPSVAVKTDGVPEPIISKEPDRRRRLYVSLGALGALAVSLLLVGPWFFAENKTQIDDNTTALNTPPTSQPGSTSQPGDSPATNETPAAATVNSGENPVSLPNDAALPATPLPVSEPLPEITPDAIPSELPLDSELPVNPDAASAEPTPGRTFDLNIPEQPTVSPEVPEATLPATEELVNPDLPPLEPVGDLDVNSPPPLDENFPAPEVAPQPESEPVLENTESNPLPGFENAEPTTPSAPAADPFLSAAAIPEEPAVTEPAVTEPVAPEPTIPEISPELSADTTLPVDTNNLLPSVEPGVLDTPSVPESRPEENANGGVSLGAPGPLISAESARAVTTPANAPDSQLSQNNNPNYSQPPTYNSPNSSYNSYGNMAVLTGTGKAYRVSSDDSYWRIAERFYGSGEYSRSLAKYNRSRIDPLRLATGMEIFIPPVETLRQQFPSLCPTAASLASGEEPAASAETRIYVVDQEESLMEIVRRELGSILYCSQVYTLNQDRLAGSIDRIKPGVKLLLPLKK